MMAPRATECSLALSLSVAMLEFILPDGREETTLDDEAAAAAAAAALKPAALTIIELTADGLYASAAAATAA